MNAGFFELVVLFVLAVLLLGPERVPALFRWLGFYYRKVKAGWYNMRDEVERELRIHEMSKHDCQQEHMPQHSTQDTEQCVNNPATHHHHPSESGKTAP